ncbi:H-type lectin domain-containing protein [Caloranaerobacter ferrireducens]|uniref:H-type lectin domain-containing protein n=1 Tax=Caloranaerobacter ferrireducens TaxID=1323370 RepID=UPI00084D268C|nr:H-type lectin domain-containing protein [Caloranaerobacter ferrireducens]
MAYTKTNWQDGVTPLSAANMNKIEDELEYLDNSVNEPLYQTITSDGESVISLPSSTEDKGQVSVGLFGNTATNIVQNGNFVDTTGWTALAGGSISAQNNTLSITGNGTSTNTIIQHITNTNWQDNKKIYTRLKVRVTNPDAQYITLEVRHSDGNVATYTINTPVQDQWYYFNEITTNTTNTGNVEIRIYAHYIDAATANGKTMEVQEVFALDLTAEGLEDKTADEINSTFPYWFDGTKSTVSTKIKVIGKNLVRNGNCEEGLNGWENGSAELTLENGYFKVTADTIGYEYVKSEVIKVKKNTTHKLSAKAKSDGNSNCYIRVMDKDLTVNLGSSSGSDLNTSEHTIEANVNTGDYDEIRVLLYALNGIGSTWYKEIQLEEGTQLTTYKEYKESIRYINLPSGVDGLNSLLNGTKDEVTDDGRLIKKCSNKVILDGSRNWGDGSDLGTVYRFSLASSEYGTNITNGGRLVIDNKEYVYDENYTSDTEHFYISPTSQSLVLFINKTIIDAETGATVIDKLKNYLNSHNGTLIYQLATPVEYSLNVTPLTAYENGTVYFEKAIPEVSFYDSVNGCQVSDTKYPIASIDFIHKVNPADGSYIALDVSQAVIAQDGLSFTHPDLQDGDLVDWDYFYAEELSTYPSAEITVATNHKAQTNSNTDAINQLSKNVQNIDDRVKANSQSIEELEQPTTLLEKIKTVDGAGSGLDTELFNGQDSSYYAKNIQGGRAEYIGTGIGHTFSITFSPAFSSTPKIFVTPEYFKRNSVNKSQITVRAYNITTTGMDVYVEEIATGTQSSSDNIECAINWGAFE